MSGDILGRSIPKFDKEVILRGMVVATEKRRENWKGKSLEIMEKECIKSQWDRYKEILEKLQKEPKFESREVSSAAVEMLGHPDFVRSIPNFDVWSRMIVQLYYRNLQAKVEENDMLDVMHLSVAVPYSDVVVCDKNMAHVLRSSGLVRKYATRVFRSLEKAANYLEGLPASS